MTARATDSLLIAPTWPLPRGSLPFIAGCGSSTASALPGARPDQKSFYKLYRCLKAVSTDRALAHAMAHLEERIVLFDQLRQAMRMAPKGASNGLNCDGGQGLFASNPFKSACKPFAADCFSGSNPLPIKAIKICSPKSTNTGKNSSPILSRCKHKPENSSFNPNAPTTPWSDSFAVSNEHSVENPLTLPWLLPYAPCSRTPLWWSTSVIPSTSKSSSTGVPTWPSVSLRSTAAPSKSRCKKSVTIPIRSRVASRKS